MAYSLTHDDQLSHYSHTKVDLSLIPEGKLKNTFILFAEQHNALVDGTNEMKQDLDLISGESKEDKAETHRLLRLIRKITQHLHSKRFNLTLLGIQGYLFCGILKLIGIEPRQISLLFDTLIKILQKVS